MRALAAERPRVPGTAATLAAVVVVAPILASLRNSADAQQAPTRRSRVVHSTALPPMDGSCLRVGLVEVTYPPGDSAPPHVHRCHVVAHAETGHE